MGQIKINKKVLGAARSFACFLVCLPLLWGAGQAAAQGNPDIARYTPAWIKGGFADAGATHEPWMFQVRRNNEGFSQWKKGDYDYMTSEEYIKSLAEAGITLYHIYFYKGYGFEAEKAHMEETAKAAAIAHKYGMKVDVYIQWNSMFYETFFAEVPEAEADLWYQIDVTGKPILLTYGYQQSFRYRPCFNNDAYMEYFKEKIIRYAVEVVKADFLYFDNFDYNYPPDADHNPATIAAFRKYLEGKYTPSGRIERFGFSDVSHVLPPMWNGPNPASKMKVINDPAMQEWVDFRCWAFTTRLAECARFARGINKEVAIEVNPHGLVGSDRAWEAGVNHPDLMQYTNAILTEDPNYPRWEGGVAIGKFRHYKLGRTTNNYILTYNRSPQDFAENLALNRAIGYLLGYKGEPGGVVKEYLDFWHANKGLYTNVHGAEKVAVLRSYPSMAYNIYETQVAVNMAEQALQQSQIPFDIIFDQQLGKLGKYYVLVLARQESLAKEVIEAIKGFVAKGGGLVLTGNTGKFDGWRRLRRQSLAEEMLSETGAAPGNSNKGEPLKEVPGKAVSFNYGKGRVIYLPKLTPPRKEIKLGFETEWVMPKNASELESAVYWATKEKLPLQVEAPGWVGVSHDTQGGREIIHLFSYSHTQNTAGVTLEYNGAIKKAWSTSPGQEGREVIPFTEEGGATVLKIANLGVYKIIVLEK